MIPRVYAKVHGKIIRTQPAPVAYDALSIRVLQHRLFFEDRAPRGTLILIKCR